MAQAQSPERRSVIAGLFILTVATGLVDAASVLGLGHVFAANMTGNVVFSGFALGGASGFSLRASLDALAAFLVGAVCAGWLVRPGATTRDTRSVFATEAIALAIAAGVAAIVARPEAGASQIFLLALLGFGMGLQNGTVRRLAVADLTTTVLTLTLTGLASDSSLVGGTNPHLRRRLTSVALMLAGAVAGARLQTLGLVWPICAAGATVAAGAAAISWTPRTSRSA